MNKFLAAIIAGFALVSAADAHEFWVEPLAFEVEPGESVAIDLSVGMMLEGRSYPYLSQKFVRYDDTVAGETSDLSGREGDLPSVRFSSEEPGLHVISYHAQPEKLEYENFLKFVDYMNDEGLLELVARHRERGLPDTGFVEAYVRNSKALVQVGPPSADQLDEVVGLPFELVALENPYLGQEKLPVQLLWQGEPVAGYQIAVFHRELSGFVTRTAYKTNEDGIATMSFTGDGMYLLSSVYLEERDPASGEAWHSTWAALSLGRSAGD